MKKNNTLPKEQSLGFLETILDNNIKAYAIFLLIIFIVFLQSVKFDFTNHDDQGLLASKELKLSNSKLIFEKGVFYFTDEIKPEKDTYYRPIQNLVYAFGKDIGGKKPAVFHFINILLHFIAACLLYQFLVLIDNKKLIAFSATLLFIVHPLLVQAIVWIPGTGELLITIFLLGSFIYLIKFLKHDIIKLNYIVISAFLFLMALLSKESAIGFFPLVVFYFFVVNKNKKNYNNKILAITISFTISLIGWYILRQHAIGQYSKVSLSSIIDSLIDNGSLILYYISKIFLPLSLSPLPSLLDVNLIVTFITLCILAIIFLFIKGKKISSILTFGILWYLLFLVPTLFLAQADFDFYTYNHRLYLPLIGIIIVIIEIFNFNHKKYSTGILYSSFFIPFILFLFMSFNYARVFKNASSFFKTSVENSPHSFLAYQGLGIEYLKNNDCDKAIDLYKKLTEMKPKVHSFYGLVGNSYLNCKNDIPNAINWYEKAMNADSKSPLASNTAISLGNIYSMALKDTTKAIDCYSKAIRIDSSQSFPMSMLGNIYLTRSNIDSANYWFKRTLQVDTGSSVAYYGLASIQYSQRKYKDAIVYFEKALQYNTTEIQIIKFLMLSYRELNDYNNTLKYAEEYKRRGAVLPDSILSYLK